MIREHGKIAASDFWSCASVLVKDATPLTPQVTCFMLRPETFFLTSNYPLIHIYTNPKLHYFFSEIYKVVLMNFQTKCPGVIVLIFKMTSESQVLQTTKVFFSQCLCYDCVLLFLKIVSVRSDNVEIFSYRNYQCEWKASTTSAVFQECLIANL